MIQQKVDAGTRLGTMILDHIIMTFVVMIFTIPGMISTFVTAFQVSHEQINPDIFGGNFSYVMLIGFAFYFCKDTINGRSPAKRLLKLQLIDNATNKVASPIKCLIRNIFCIFWPIEGIIALINPQRRIGDFVAGTKLVRLDPTMEQQKPNWGQVAISLVIAYGLMLTIMIPFENIKSGMKSKQIDFEATSFNPLDSKATEELFADSLGNYLTADIRVYDKIKNADLKYISAIFHLKEDYLASEESFDKLKSFTTRVLLSKFPEKSFVSSIQYVYRSGAKMHSRAFQIDWRETENK